MHNFLPSIFKEKGIEFYGFCDFLLLKDNLLNCRAKSRLPYNSSTVITCLFPYKVRDEKPLNISRYSAVKDYHIVCGEILSSITKKLKENYPENDFEFFIDNSPINEVKAAALCGLGVVGKNRLLINEKYGSFCFIGEIVTDYKIQTVNNLITSCINCNRCLSACPTGFLKDKNKKCLSCITQQKTPLLEDEEKLIKKTKIIWGCDVCQEVCPMNKEKENTNIFDFISSYKEKYCEGENINDRAFAWRGEKVILRNYNILK